MSDSSKPEQAEEAQLPDIADSVIEPGGPGAGREGAGGPGIGRALILLAIFAASSIIAVGVLALAAYVVLSLTTNGYA